MECPICLEEYDLISRRPHIVPCSGAHELCSACLEQIRSVGSWSCPSCRESIAGGTRVNSNRGMVAAIEARADAAAPRAQQRPRPRQRRPPRGRGDRKALQHFTNMHVLGVTVLGAAALLGMVVANWNMVDDDVVDDHQFFVTEFNWFVEDAFWVSDEQLDESGFHVAYSDPFESGLSKWRLRFYPAGHMNGKTHLSIGIESLDAPRFHEGWYRLVMATLVLKSRAEVFPHEVAAFEAAAGRKAKHSVVRHMGHGIFTSEQSYMVVQNFTAINDVFDVDGTPRYEFVDEQGRVFIQLRMMVAKELGDLSKDQFEASLDPSSGAAPINPRQPWTDKAWMERRFQRTFGRGLPRV